MPSSPSRSSLMIPSIPPSLRRPTTPSKKPGDETDSARSRSCVSHYRLQQIHCKKPAGFTFITTRLSKFVPGGRGARQSQTKTLCGWGESPPTVESEFCSNRNGMLHRRHEVKHGGLFACLVVCGNRHSSARDCDQGSLHPPGPQSAAHDLRPASAGVLRRLR